MVPRDRIELPTRGFSILAQSRISPRNLWVFELPWHPGGTPGFSARLAWPVWRWDDLADRPMPNCKDTHEILILPILRSSPVKDGFAA